MGVNDIDEESGVDVAFRIRELLNATHCLYPNVKITLNEITPRNDSRDEQVIECNKELQSYDRENLHIFLAKQSNLRDNTYSFFHDEKHVKKNKIGRYASNLKSTLRKAYGIEDPRKSIYRNQSTSLMYNHTQVQDQWRTDI